MSANRKFSSLKMLVIMPKKRAINWVILFAKLCKDLNIILVDYVDSKFTSKDELIGFVLFSFQNYKPAICCDKIDWENKEVFDNLLLKCGTKSWISWMEMARRIATLLKDPKITFYAQRNNRREEKQE
jgi:hypothetical protein